MQFTSTRNICISLCDKSVKLKFVADNELHHLLWHSFEFEFELQKQSERMVILQLVQCQQMKSIVNEGVDIMREVSLVRFAIQLHQKTDKHDVQTATANGEHFWIFQKI